MTRTSNMSVGQISLGQQMHPSQLRSYGRGVIARLGIVAIVVIFFHLGLWLHLPLFGVTAESLLLASVLSGALLGPVWGAASGFVLGGVHDLLSPTPLGLGCLVFCISGYGMARLVDAFGMTRWWQSSVYGMIGLLGGVALFASVGELLGQEYLINERFPRVVWVQVLFALVLSPGFWWMMNWVALGGFRSETRRRPRARRPQPMKPGKLT